MTTIKFLVIVFLLILIFIVQRVYYFFIFQKFFDNLKSGQTVLIKYAGRMMYATFISFTGSPDYVMVKLFKTNESICIETSKIYKP